MSSDLSAVASKFVKHVKLKRKPPKLPEGSNVFIPRKSNVNSFRTRNGSSTPKFDSTVAVKDNIATTGSTTTCASGFLKDYVSPLRASVIRQLGQCDYVVEEKTNMDEFGMGSHSTHSYFGSVSNVISATKRSAGGSSGGSAMAVALGLRKFALGTDTGGSVRLPAAYTGVVGFKPSYGLISRWGVIPYANSLDTVGIFSANCSEQLDQFLNSLLDHDPQDPTCHTVGSRDRLRLRSSSKSISRKLGERLRIGVPIEYNIQELQPIVRAAWYRVLKQLQKMGHIVVPVSLPSTKHALSAYYVLAAAEAASNLAKYDGVRYGTPMMKNNDPTGAVLYDNVRGSGFGDEVKRRILLGSYTLSSEAMDNYFIQAQKVRRLVQMDFDRVFALSNPLRQPEQFDLSDLDEGVELESKRGPAQVDVLVCPTAPTLPPLLEDVQHQAPVDSYMNDVFTVPASLAGLPAVSIPTAIVHGEANIQSAGIQVIGQYGDDSVVLKVGGLIEQVGEMAVSKETTIAHEECTNHESSSNTILA